MLNILNLSGEKFNTWINGVHVFPNFILKNMSSIWENFIHEFEVFQGSFFIFLYNEKMSREQGWHQNLAQRINQ